jgi:membrane protease YdiL (CAAX protease family)
VHGPAENDDRPGAARREDALPAGARPAAAGAPPAVPPGPDRSAPGTADRGSTAPADAGPGSGTPGSGTPDGGNPGSGTPDGGIRDGGIQDGAIPYGTSPDGAIAYGTTPDGGIPEAAASATATAGSATPEHPVPGPPGPTGTATAPGPVGTVPASATVAVDPWAGPAGYPATTGHPPQQPPRPEPAAPRTHRWGLGAYLLVEVVFLAASFLVGFLVVGGGQVGAGGLALALGVPTVLAAGTALLITRLRGNGPRADLRLDWTWRDVGLGVAFGVGGLVVTIPASVLFVAIVGEGATSAVGEVFSATRASVPVAVLIFLIVVLLAPLCEEIVYRGLLWGGVEKLAGPRVAFAVSTLLFALAHFEFTRTPLLLVVAIPIAAARLYTGRLLASIIAHQINNLLPGVALLLALLGVVPLA